MYDNPCYDLENYKTLKLNSNFPMYNTADEQYLIYMFYLTYD